MPTVKLVLILSLCVPVVQALVHMLGRWIIRGMLRNNWVAVRQQRVQRPDAGRAEPWFQNATRSLTMSAFSFYALVHLRAYASPDWAPLGLWAPLLTVGAVMLYVFHLYVDEIFSVARCGGRSLPWRLKPLAVLGMVCAVLGVWWPAAAFLASRG